MGLVNGFELIKLLKENNQIGGAFNTTNLETTIGILQAIEESGVPSFIQVAPTNLTLAGYKHMVEMVRHFAEKMTVPVSLHLDHGKNFEDFKNACDSGFNSVMIDGASFDFEENIQYTKKAVEYAKKFGIPVEAELGAISGKEDDDVSESDNKTNTNQVLEFVERTGCDMLAVSVGNVHGLDGIPNIDFELINEIQKKCPVPLVIHGGSGIDDSVLTKLKENNIVKVNIASDLRNAYISSIGKSYEKNNNEANLIKVLVDATNAVKETVIKKINVLN